ncbi:S1 RNA binding domain protein [Neorickettsia helminthoeca str. Oregon]|uniref:S1 RNA binding domain protein n=2 Tax=Neorickettsia helminthoeca TaxID=33994 RepID=X5H3R6_9RICK|nr:S1 RNA binding domain protein [Neorickettsia helminthoeca str. Oregon]
MIKEGDVVEGIIKSVSPHFVLVNLGLKSEGKIPIQQFPNVDELQIGSSIMVYVEKTETGGGSLVLSYTKALKQKVWDRLYDMYLNDSEQDIEGVILYTIKSGCIVEVEGLNAFLPNSHLDVRPVSDPATLVGVKLKFRILKMEPKTGKIFVSRKKALGAVHESARAEYISTIKEGEIIDGRVKSIASYGVFIQIHESDKVGVVDGLLYINDISWARVTHPSSIYSVGQEVRVKVIGVDTEKGRISLGVKQLTDNPWKDISKKYTPGNIYPGVVTSIEDYGVFVRLEEGVEGLVHSGEISWTREKPLFLPNQKVNVMLLSVDEESHKIALSIRQCNTNPWKKFLEAYGLGVLLKCRVAEITDSGMVLMLVDQDYSYVRGYVRVANISWSQNPRKDLKRFKVGDEVQAKLVHVNADRGRVMFSLKYVEYDPFEEFIEAVNEGELIEAKIMRVEDDGIYIEVREGLEFFTAQADVSRLAVGQRLKFVVCGKERYSIKLSIAEDQKSMAAEEKEVDHSVENRDE